MAENSSSSSSRILASTFVAQSLYSCSHCSGYSSAPTLARRSRGVSIAAGTFGSIRRTAAGAFGSLRMLFIFASTGCMRSLSSDLLCFNAFSRASQLSYLVCCRSNELLAFSKSSLACSLEDCFFLLNTTCNFFSIVSFFNCFLSCDRTSKALHCSMKWNLRTPQYASKASRPVSSTCVVPSDSACARLWTNSERRVSSCALLFSRVATWFLAR
mmetsp:Transcript_131499/g.195924  ORF Transcript_131499/g.195924 Transcript_131499/m.195924 type:complete len:214 (-) Transcript_131499:1096-1737(-)